jgi:putative methyltransferase (TIGR04325 family)
MHLRDLLKQLVPPLLLKVLKSSRHQPIFSSYDEALAACGKDGYEGEDIVRAVVEKNVNYRKTIQSNRNLDLASLRTLIGLGLANSKEELSVLDFGGGGGYHYTLAKAALGNIGHLKWNVVETTAMAKEAERIADGDLKFFDNITDAKNDLGAVDLVLTSSALQYCPSPLALLRELTAIGAKYIFITRTPFSDSKESLVSIQVSKLSHNGPGPLPSGFDDRDVSYPITFASKYEVEKILAERYEIRFVINEDKGTFSAGKKTFDLSGYFCVLKQG